MLFWITLKSGQQLGLIAWLIAFFIAVIYRFSILVWYNSTRKKERLLRIQFILYYIGTSFSALLWGLLGSVLMQGSIVQQILVILAINGITTGALLSLSASYLVNITYVLLTLVPVLIWLAIHFSITEPIYLVIFVYILVFLIFIIISSYNNYNILVENIKLKLEHKAMSEYFEEKSIHDPLTKLFNREYLFSFVNLEIARAERKKTHFAVLMFDIDHFKNFNDTLGHQVGDLVLSNIAAFLMNEVRANDIVCRYGGEEFVLVMTEISLKIARKRAEKIREKVKKIPIVIGKDNSITLSVSIGIAEYPRHGETVEALIKSADEAMYQAKLLGRDRVVIKE